jgi:hypothetical protein
MSKHKNKLIRLLDSPVALEKWAKAVMEPLMRDVVYENRVRGLFKGMAQPCSKCHVSLYEHGGLEGESNHPFFRNNLEMLEWIDRKHEDAKRNQQDL